jgi:GNAT superfamily N-acetyltransferase
VSILQIQTVDQFPNLFGCYEQSLPLVSKAEFELHAPTSHLLWIQDDQPLARCSLWASTGLIWQEQTLGVLGHYAALEEKAGSELLKNACHQLEERGCSAVVGPMDGSTWFCYRLITERGNHPAFVLEPDHPPEWPRHFLQAGFKPLTHYVSSLVEDLETVDPRLCAVEHRLDKLGVEIFNLVDRSLSDYLGDIHQLCLQAFAHNFLYTPLERERFLSLYQPMVNILEPRLVQLAYHAENLVGFIFALPDLAQIQRGEPLDTVVLKTVAVKPGRSYAGLGNWLVQRCHHTARQLGLKRAIHALMHEKNSSRNVLGGQARPFRRYTLFLWEAGQ